MSKVIIALAASKPKDMLVDKINEYEQEIKTLTLLSVIGAQLKSVCKLTQVVSQPNRLVYTHTEKNVDEKLTAVKAFFNSEYKATFKRRENDYFDGHCETKTLKFSVSVGATSRKLVVMVDRL